MSDVVAKLAELGIRPMRGQSFRTEADAYTVCPQCSPNRKPANRNKPVLSVKLDADGGAVWFCNHCDWSGNVPAPRQGRDGRPMYGSRPKPTPRPARAAPPPDQRQRPAAMIEWFASRGIPPEIVDEMGIYHTAVRFPQDAHLAGDPPDWSRVPLVPSIAFPYTVDGVVVNHKYRDVDKRFAQDPKTLRSLYNVDQTAEDVWIWVEGEMDVLAALAAGYRSVVSLPDGAPKQVKEDGEAAKSDKRFAPLETHQEQIARVRKHIIATDGDGPGHALAEELARRLGKERCWRVGWPEGTKDANEVLVRFGADALRKALDGARPYPLEGLYDLEPGALLRLRRSPKAKTYSTGFRNLDEFIQIPTDGRLFVVTGVPNSGKSEWVDAVLVNTGRKLGWHSIICSPENNPVELHAAKLAEKWAGSPFLDYGPHMPCMSDMLVQQAEDWLAEHTTFIRADVPGKPLKLDWILDRASQAVLRRGSRWLVIDPWNRLEHERPGNRSETEYVAESLSRMAAWGAAHACNVILVAHPQKLQRDQGTRKYGVPGGYEIAGSAHFFNIPDFGITVHRPDMNTTDVEIHVWKVRFKHHGRKGMARLAWDKNTGRYDETP
ncbi:toprim domain-containing protein [Azospirillum sp. ST 5-10]|uniref:toprim domain-containing protein n=1 Tax=unclassified Azospirillum TaxID=2630922 RepID=UPI003F49DC9F